MSLQYRFLRRRARLGPRRAGFLLLATGFVLLAGGCSADLPRWPWWSAADSAAVRSALADWRDYLDAGRNFEGTVASGPGWSSRLVGADSLSATGDTLYKLRRIVAVSYEATDSGHADVLEFGPSVDTIEMSDTFCFVSWYDSMAGCRLVVGYDSLWVVGYRPDTTIQGEPPETLVTWRASYSAGRGFDAPRQATKPHAWKAFRGLHLPKEPGVTSYHLERLTGVEVTVPGGEDAPDVAHVILYRPGRSDTFFDRPRADGRGLMNLRALDSLHTFEPGEEVRVVVGLRSADAALFFAGVGGEWRDITAGATTGDGTVAFRDTGYQHVNIQVLPVGRLFYPEAGHAANVWAIPVRVVGR
ncbi:MAG: hypothetical protein R6X12_07510 [bacterium]